MDILFWSGGKDAWLALQFYRKHHSSSSLKLLTTYNKKTGIVPHQNIELDDIKKQAEQLELDLITVPLPENPSNEVYLDKMEEALASCKERVQRLVFGDWHLQDIRDWREKVFGKMGYDCLFPIWKKELNELLPELLLKPVEIRISAVRKEYEKLIRVGELYNQRFIRQLPDEIDPMGENGEFHTRLHFTSWDKPARKIRH